jgi:hypothetical protein
VWSNASASDEWPACAANAKRFVARAFVLFVTILRGKDILVILVIFVIFVRAEGLRG